MNIVLATRFYPPDTGGGGIAAYAHYLSMGLQRAGHKVRVISRMTPQSYSRSLVDGVEVRRIQPLGIPYRYHSVPVVGRYLRFSNDLFYAQAARAQLLRLSEDQAPDLVEYADIDAEGIFHPAKVSPAVLKLHTPHFVLSRFYTGKEIPYNTGSVGWLEKRSILRADRLSSPSHSLARIVAQEYRFPVDRIAWVPNPIDTDFFAPNCQSDEAGLIVLYVGRLEPRKGAIIFAHAIPEIARWFPKARFIFLGADRLSANGGSQKAEIQACLADQGVASEQVEFYGHAPPEVFREYYHQATVIVVPSMFENCPYTLLEAMASGKAVVVSQCYGMQEMIVDGESGLFFEPGNAIDLAEKTIQVLENKSLRERLGQGARTTVLQNYSLEVGTEKTLAFYRDVLGSWKG